MITKNRLTKEQAIAFAEDRVWIQSGRRDEYVLNWLWHKEGEENRHPYVGERRTHAYPEKEASVRKLLTAMASMDATEEETDLALRALEQSWELYKGTSEARPEPGAAKPDWKSYLG